MDSWASVLKPTTIKIVFAPIDPSIMIGGNTQEAEHDRSLIKAWLVFKVANRPEIVESSVACMSCGGGRAFGAGRPCEVDPTGALFNGNDKLITLVSHGAGTYDKTWGKYTVIGKDRNHQ